VPASARAEGVLLGEQGQGAEGVLFEEEGFTGLPDPA
jgi:hypothetical protein